MNNNIGMFETKKCKHCFEDINAAATTCPKCGGSQGIPTYAIVLIIIGVLILIGAGLIISYMLYNMKYLYKQGAMRHEMPILQLSRQPCN